MTAAMRGAGPIAALALSSAITSLDFTIIFVTIPSIQTAFGVSVTGAQWVATTYAVAFGGCLLLGGRLADAYGAHRCFVCGLVGFGVSSAVGGLAPVFAVLVAARAAQGMSAAVLFPATLALLYQVYPNPAATRRALAVWAAAGSGGLIAGTILGGLLTQLVGWEAVMWVNVPMVGAAVLLAGVGRLRDRAIRRAGGKVGAASWITALAMAVVVGSACLLALQLPQWGLGPRTMVVAAVAAVVAAGARFVSRRSGAGLISRRVVTESSVVAATVRGMVFMGAFGTVYFLLSLDLQTVRGLGPLVAGAALIPGSVGGVVGSAVAARLLASHRPGVISAGSMVAGAAGLAAIAAGVLAPMSILLLILALSSLTQGVAYAAIFALAGSRVSHADQGVATSLASTGQQVGSAIGLAVAALCIQHMNARADVEGMRAGIVLALAIGAALVLITGLAGFRGGKIAA